MLQAEGSSYRSGRFRVVGNDVNFLCWLGTVNQLRLGEPRTKSPTSAVTVCGQPVASLLENQTLARRILSQHWGGHSNRAH